KALADPTLRDLCRPLVIGQAAVLQKALDLVASPLRLISIGRPADTPDDPRAIPLLDLPHLPLGDHRWGVPTKAGGTAAYEAIRTAARLALAREVAAMVTAPINKEIFHAAGYPYPGHTELLAELSGAKEVGMLLVGGPLKVLLVTTHAALKEVPGLIKKKRVLTALRLAHHAGALFGIPYPRIAVAALNPHAGEGGVFGHEEQEEILPAVLQARGEGIHVSDPLPADTLFHQAYHGHYDLVVAMYHDQGLGPLKMLAFGRAVNVTVGLPFIRTSVDHGTAYDLAGKNQADPGSLIEAIRLAVRFIEPFAR
ncbi:MAG: 4-hydroxythreonine-4-phosphate dehydrogenase PdxA, partial [Nitrospirae bacterium]|nr:4-hydroxythreonine-4-phosphate dehydrogenase PdxA [Nitrospirota bacterium]